MTTLFILMLINNYLFYIDIWLIIIRCMMFKPGSLTSPALLLWQYVAFEKPEGLSAWGFCFVSINMALARTLSPFLSPRTRAQIACLSLRTTDLDHEILWTHLYKSTIPSVITHLWLCVKRGNLLVPS